MADNSVAERLQPSLLDRLTDDAPTSLKETRESRVIDITRLRDIIQRDLVWLLNTQNNEISIDPKVYPNVSQSVLNYGVRPTSGEQSTRRQADLIRKSINEAVATFEPRIVPGSANVELSASESGGEMIIAFDIHADMWAQPMPLELYLRSRIDLTTGEVQMERVH